MAARQSHTKNDPPSPSSASFYDVSDDEEGYNTIAHANTTRQGRAGVKLLFSKSKVYVHPSPSARDNIAGFIALVQQRSAPLASEGGKPQSTGTRPNDSSQRRQDNASKYLLAWVPESSLAQDDLSTYVKVDLNDAESAPRQTNLVAPPPVSSTYDDSNVGPYAFSLPLSSIYSIMVRPPSIGWWFGSIVINTRSASSLPALFFHDSECESTILQKKKRARESFDPFGENGDLFWGGDEVVRWLKRYVHVERSTAEPSVYLIDPSDEDKFGFGQGRKSLESPDHNKTGGSAQKKPAEASGLNMDPLTKALKETRWKLLESFSKITTFTRRTAQDLANNKNIPPQMRNLLQNPDVRTISDEFDSARIYLARWAMSIAEQSDREKRQRIWTAKDVLETEESEVGDFEILGPEAGHASSNERRRRMELKEWNSFFDSRGRLQVPVDEVKERIFHGGLYSEDGVRKQAWPFLLGVYEWDSTADERRALMNSKRDQYIQLKGAWWERMIEGQATNEQEEWWKEQKLRIEKDVHRTDRHIPLFAGEDIPHPDPSSPFYQPDAPGTNVHMEQLKDMLLTYLEYDSPPSANSSRPGIYNPHAQNLGYVQGMSDLLSPLYAVFQDDAVAFWCFTCFMDRMSRNFARSQAGMRSQLSTLDQLVQLLDPELYLHLQKLDSTNFFFFFRMLLVWYKREFDWSDVLRLWESLWTDYLSSQFHLFIAVAILEKHRDPILTHLKGFDEILKYINELSGHIDLLSTLTRAENLFRRFEKTVQTIDARDHFTAPGEGKPNSTNDTSSNDNGKTRDSSIASSSAPSGPASHSRNSSTTGPSSTNTTTTSPAKVEETKKEIVTPQLRLLLSRKIITIDDSNAATAGGANDMAGRTRKSGLKD